MNTIYCGVVGPGNPENSLATQITVIPMEAYILIKACDAMITSCKTSAHLVEFN
jgi:hypothetical protein